MTPRISFTTRTISIVLPTVGRWPMKLLRRCAQRVGAVAEAVGARVEGVCILAHIRNEEAGLGRGERLPGNSAPTWPGFRDGLSAVFNLW
jgi:hypothetical protein